MQVDKIFEKLQSEFPNAAIELKQEQPVDAFIVVPAENLFDIALFLRDDKDLLFDYLACLSGMDYKENLGVVYHLDSMTHRHKIVIKVLIPKDNPNVHTVERVWRTADWHEREAYDLFGVKFEGHHNLIRILNPYDWEDYPLRKDYKVPETYHGMKVPY